MSSLAKRLQSLVRTLRGIWAIPVVRLASLVSLSVILFAFLPASLALGLLIFIVFTAYNLSSKYLSILSLALLSAIPILLYFGYEGISEEFAVYVYFLLIVVVALELKSYLFENLFKLKPAPESASEEEGFFDSTPPTSPREPEPLKPVIEASPTRSTPQPTVAAQTTNQPETTLEPVWTGEPALRQELRRESPARTSRQVLTRLLRTSRSRLIGGNLGVILVFASLSLLFFNFAGLPHFRDLTTLPFYFQLDAGGLDLVFFERTVYNFFVNIRVPARVIVSVYWQLVFFAGLMGTYFFTFRIQRLFVIDTAWIDSRRNRWIVFLLTTVFVFNPWTYERILMGQHKVIIGHLLFVPVLFYLLRYLRTYLPTWNEPGDTHLKYFARFSWAVTLLTLYSAHHTFFVLGLIAITLGHHFVWRVVLYERSKTPARYFHRFWKLTSLTLLVLLPSGFILLNRYAGNDSTQFSYFNTQVSQNADYEAQIIRSFSPVAAPNESLPQQVLIGAASWMTPSFIEPEEGRALLSFFAYLTYYYNPILGWLLILVMLVILAGLMYQADKHPHPILYPLLGLVPLSLLLTFGYATPAMRGVNQLFYALPFSYTLRESGKFYSLFLALTLVFVAVYAIHQKKLLRRLLLVTLSLATVSNLLLFLPLRRTIPYFNFPTEMTSVVTDLCEEENPQAQVLFYPFQTYVNTAGIDTFSSYPYRHLTPCPAFVPNRAAVKTPEDDTLTLYRDEVALTIDTATDRYVASLNEAGDYEAYKKDLRDLGVRLIVIDSTHYAELATLENHLSQYLNDAAEPSPVSIFALP